MRRANASVETVSIKRLVNGRARYGFGPSQFRIKEENLQCSTKN